MPPSDPDVAEAGGDGPHEPINLHATFADETVDYGVQPTNTLHLANFDAPTPTHIERANTITTRQLQGLLNSPRPPVLVDVIGGQCQVIFDLLPSSVGYIRSGSLRALAVTTAQRSDALSDVPVLADALPGYEASAWIGIGAPKDTPVEIVEELNRAINAGLADPGLKARFAELGGAVLPGSPEDFAKFIVGETEKWGRVIKFANIKGP